MGESTVKEDTEDPKATTNVCCNSHGSITPSPATVKRTQRQANDPVRHRERRTVGADPRFQSTPRGTPARRESSPASRR